MLKKYLSRLVLGYFRALAKLQLKKNPQAIIIGITGSAGKTSVRLALVQILKTHGTVKHSSHANSESGISLNILGLRPSTYSLFDWLSMIILAPVKLLTNQERFKYYVVEMGIDSPESPKNMNYLLSIIRPHVAVILNAGMAHTGNFDYLVKDNSTVRRVEKLIQLIAKEKMQLAKGIGKKGVAIINLDQKEFAKERRDVRARQITFGVSNKADLQIIGGSRFKYQGNTHKLMLKETYPDFYDYTFAAAIAAAAAVGIPPSISMASLSSYHAPSGRMQFFRGANDSTIIDSSYNASPGTMLQSLKLLKAMAHNHKKIAVIGDMLELGLSTKYAHKDLADWVQLYCDEVVLFGSLTKQHCLPVLESKHFKVHHFDRITDLNRYLLTTIRPKSYILIKGSQNNLYLERVVEAILASRDDVSRLCRRGPYWDEIRAKTP